MKKIEENLTQEEFNEYCLNIRMEMEGDTYFGQQDEFIPYNRELQRKHIYVEGKEDTEEGHKFISYVKKLDKEETEILYDIYYEFVD